MASGYCCYSEYWGFLTLSSAVASLASSSSLVKTSINVVLPITAVEYVNDNHIVIKVFVIFWISGISNFILQLNIKWENL